MKLCIDCYHYSKRPETDDEGMSHQVHACYALLGTVFPINGKYMNKYIDCITMRMGPCGLEGKMFKEKITPFPSQLNWDRAPLF